MEALDEPSINEFNAAQYSFFGDGPSIAAGALEAVPGTAQEGLEGPPDEEGLPDDGLDVDDEDLSLATMLRNQAVEDITESDTAFAAALAHSLPVGMFSELEEPVRPQPQLDSMHQTAQQVGTYSGRGLTHSSVPAPTVRAPLTAQELEARMLSKAAADACASSQPHSAPGNPILGPTYNPYDAGPPMPVHMPGPGHSYQQGPPPPLMPSGQHEAAVPPPWDPAYHMYQMYQMHANMQSHAQYGPPQPFPSGMHQATDGPHRPANGAGPPPPPPPYPQHHPMEPLAPQPPPPMHPQQHGWAQHLVPAAPMSGGWSQGGGSGQRPGGPVQHSAQPPHPPYTQLAGTSQPGRGPPLPPGPPRAWVQVRNIMQIMFKAVHNGTPYQEDYYYQAFVNKHSHARNARIFKPEALHDLSADIVKLDPSAAVKFVDLDGLGKIVLGNIRTPKVLMDLTSALDGLPEQLGEALGGENASGRLGSGLLSGVTANGPVAAKPLEQEPRLAARIMVEDCLTLLLDVDDINRCFLAAQAAGHTQPENSAGLRQRRTLLETGVTAAFRLPATPSGAGAADTQAASSMDSVDSKGCGVVHGAGSGAEGGGGSDDGVFLRIMALPKGRSLLARALRVLLSHPPGYIRKPSPLALPPASQPPPPADSSATGELIARNSPHLLLWALMRNANRLFGAAGLAAPDAAAQAALVQANHTLANAACQAIRLLTCPQQVLQAVQAYIAGSATLTASQGPSTAALDRVIPLSPHSSSAPAQPPVQSTSGPQPPPSTAQTWLGQVLVALVQKGQELMAGPQLGSAGAWADAMAALGEVYVLHLGSLAQAVEGVGASSEKGQALVNSLAGSALWAALAQELPQQQRAAAHSRLEQLGVVL
ncbi:hypothetical protein QJQ45_021272 [Haematococcus lacustris]|nr:hypothetical protein QJQ45_021272 [Haematococcus lacustris]